MRAIRVGLTLLGITIVQIVLNFFLVLFTILKSVFGVVGLLCSGPAALGMVTVLALAGHAVVARVFYGAWPATYTLASLAHDYVRWLPQFLVNTILGAPVFIALIVLVILLAVSAYCLVLAAIWLGRASNVLAHGALVTIAEDKRNLRAVETTEITEVIANPAE